MSESSIVGAERYTNAVKEIDSEHSEFYKENVYDFHFYSASLASGASQDILITIPSTLNFIHVSSIDCSFDTGPMRLFLYEETTVSANGTPVTVQNLNRLSSKTTLTTIFSSPTVTNTGTQIHFDFVPASKQVGGNTSGFTFWDHIVLKPNTNYLLRLTNDSAQASKVSMHIVWFERVA